MRFKEENAPDVIAFNGITFKRMGGSRRYYLGRCADRPKGLHVAIWEHHSGMSVPRGHEVHHKDHDTFNFEVDNLECLPKGKHRSMPKKNGIERKREILDRIRPLASAWHSSPEGREWHRKHAFESIRKPGAKVPRHPFVGMLTCFWCGTKCKSYSTRKLFCSPKCQIQESGFRLGKYKFQHPYHARRVP